MSENAANNLMTLALPGETAPRARLNRPWRFLIALAALFVAFAVRMALDPFLGERLPMVCFFLAVTFTAWYCGLGPALMALVLSWLIADWFFMAPRGSLEIPHRATLLSAISFFSSSLVTIIFSHSMHMARARADHNAREALKNQRLLELEVAERKRAEEEVRRLNSELEQRVAERTGELVSLNQELESFTYSVSHDLRAPLRHMDGYAQILEREFGSSISPEALRCVAKVRQGSQKMGHLVDDLLNLSRIGKQELNRQPVALNPLVAEVVSELQSEAGNRTIQWRIGTLPTVNCDPGLLKQVFINLLSNSVKYTRPRERAEIAVETVSVNGETIIEIRDNGVGFDMRFAEKLFGVFQRLHRANEFEGTGVGLATVLRIVRKHGGRIWAEAEVDKGARFFLALESAAKPK